MTGNNRNNNGEITFEIVEHIGVLDVMDNREEKWTKEVNLVAWNGGNPKIDIRDWNATHERMSRGITLTEDQALRMTKALADRFRAKSVQEHSTPIRDNYAR